MERELVKRHVRRVTPRGARVRQQEDQLRPVLQTHQQLFVMRAVLVEKVNVQLGSRDVNRLEMQALLLGQLERLPLPRREEHPGGAALHRIKHRLERQR